MKFVTFVALLALAAGGCKKNAPGADLPPATQTGANTGGCYINGERFVATGWGGSILSNPTPPLSGGFYEDSLYYLTLAGKTNRGNTHVYIFFRSQSPGTYAFNKNTFVLNRAGLRYTLNYAACDFSDNGEVYITDAAHVGQVVLNQYNSNASVSSGTFDFIAASTLDPSKTIAVTSGRFDRKQ